MEKIVNQKAWLLVLPVFALVAFSAILPLMTVVNYSVQDTFGNNQFVWNGIGWFQELLDPSKELGGRFFEWERRARGGRRVPRRCRAGRRRRARPAAGRRGTRRGRR